ncbi:MAG: AAA family ATPase [Chloroflexota bacterium]
MKKQVIYAAPSYADLRRDNGYFVDKTEYVAKLERINNPVFLRPRRFGKSFMCSTLQAYYDLRYKDQFDELFGDTWIGQNPTGQQNKYIVLNLNFSSVRPADTLAEIEQSFKSRVNQAIHLLRFQYAPLLDALPPIDINGSTSDNLSTLIMYTTALNWPQLFVIIDEYDNFANRLIVSHRDHLYDELTDDDSFLKVFFKVLKEGKETGAIKNNYITGILPLTIDDLASAFNVGTFLTLDPAFEAMVGFTQEEVDALLDEIFVDYEFPAHMRSEIDTLLKTHYNGYHFAAPASHEDSVSLYNTTILMYFLRYWTEHRKFPPQLTDENLRTDIGWVRRLAVANPDEAEKFVNALTVDRAISYSNSLLGSQFNVQQFFAKGFFPISFFHLGLLTRQDHFYLTSPNLNMYEIFIEYFNERHKINTTDPFIKPMQAFAHRPNLESLFRCYWHEYVSQLPEAIFMQVNENFYRTTFYQLCTQHLSTWFVWNVERSYPSGKSDLEFVGKFNEKFADMHWVIEFKYYSKSKMQEKNVDLATFDVLDEDADQVMGYVNDLKKESPDAQISQFVIYCFANEGFRVFEIE